MVLDTNILIEITKDHALFSEILETLPPEELIISRLACVEYLSYPLFHSVQIVMAKEFLRQFRCIDTNEPIADLAASLRRKSGLKLADSVILATAQFVEQPLLTLDLELLKRYPDITCSVESLESLEIER